MAPPAAPSLRRLLAAVLDTVVLFAFATVLLEALGGRPLWRRPAAGEVALRIIVATVVAAVYFGATMTRSNGRTLGKRAVGARVARLDHEPLTLRLAVWRDAILKIGLIELMGLLVGAVGALAAAAMIVDIAWAFGNPERRALHDVAARTRVVVDERQSPPHERPALAQR